MPPSYSSGPVSGIETLSPGSTRRRVFVHPDVKSHSMLVLTFARLYLGDPSPSAPDPDVVDSIENGGAPVEKVLGSRMVQIDLPFVKRVKLDVPAATVTLEYANLGTVRSAAIAFAGPAAAEALFSKLWRRLGDDFDLKQDKPEPWPAVQVPLVVGLAILLASGVTAAAGYVDWMVSVTAGVVGVAAAAGVAYSRLSGAPTRLELVRK